MILLLVATGTAGVARAQPLPLEGYLSQVERSNPAYRGLVAARDGALATAGEAGLLFGTQVFGTFQYVDNTLASQAPAIQGTKNFQRDMTVGLRKQTRFGLQLQLAFVLNQSSLLNVDGNIVAYPDFQTTYVTPIFNLSLWQNLWGALDRANERMAASQSLSEAHQRSFEAQATLVDAEARYWKLAAAREAVRIQAASYQRSIAVRDLDERKAARHLADRSDLLLARAAVKGKELELGEATEAARAASRAFNAARGLDSDQVPEELALPPVAALLAQPVPPRTGDRADVLAAEEGAAASTAGAEMARQKLLPSVNVYGSIFAFGLNLAFPLDVPLTSSVRAGYSRQMAAADLLYAKKAFDQETEWKELVRGYEEAQHRLAIALDLEKLQLEKYENARNRRERGLEVAFQVYQYELDYLASSLNRVQLVEQILGLRAQMKLYGGKP